MTECNAIIEANNEINKLKRENKRLNTLCVKYGFKMGRLEEEKEILKKQLGYRIALSQDYNNECDELFDENQELKEENEQLKRENELLAGFIRKNHDVTMINRILNE